TPRQRRVRSGSVGQNVRELLSAFALSPFHSVDCSCSSVGPIVEAFGFERIIFGSAPSPISRQAFAELSVNQESVDAVFGGNAQCIYVAGSLTAEVRL
ncbi:hypothetical protein BGY98DRAFT_985866, partial [Russula aff. rugulosa BPL654]